MNPQIDYRDIFQCIVQRIAGCATGTHVDQKINAHPSLLCIVFLDLVVDPAEAERRSLFQTLKQLRLVAYSDLTGPDQWIGIREIIMHFTLNGVVDALAERECPTDGAGGGPESLPEVESFDDENRPGDDGEDET